MKSCTFFGHRQIYEKIEDILTTILINLVEKDVDTFYVGSQGDFDHIVINILKSLKIKYPHISYYIVLAYLPVTKSSCHINCFENTIYPEGLEFGPQKYAIIKRNQWMIEKSDYVIVYVKHTFSNAAKLKRFSEKKGKFVIDMTQFVE